jgi:hypothetical protein
MLMLMKRLLKGPNGFWISPPCKACTPTIFTTFIISPPKGKAVLVTILWIFPIVLMAWVAKLIGVSWSSAYRKYALLGVIRSVLEIGWMHAATTR